MSKFVIIPDPTSDINKELRERFNVPEIVTGTVLINDKIINYNGDWTEISSKEFWAMLKNKKNTINTGAPSPEIFKQSFEKYLKQGLDVLCITISSALSATNGFAIQAAKELMEKYPERKVLVIDSRRYAAAELLLVTYASKFQEEGLDIEQTYQKLEEIKNCLHQAGPMDDLMFLASRKRITNTKAFMGQLIGVNPIGEVDKDGLTKVLCKVKGSKKALATSLEYMKRTIVNPEEQIIIISHSDREEKAKLYKEMIEQELKVKEIILIEGGMACAPNIGPGLCAAYYVGKPISDNLVEEQAIFDEITKK